MPNSKRNLFDLSIGNADFLRGEIALASRLVSAVRVKTDEESVAFLYVNSAAPFSASFGAPDVLNVDFRGRVIQLRQLARVESAMMSVPPQYGTT